MIRNPDDSPPAVLYQESAAYGRGRFHYPADEADIVFFNRPGSEGILHHSQRMGILGEQAESAGFIIQAVTGRRRKKRIGQSR